MRAAEILARWRAGREAAPVLPEAPRRDGDAALFPAVPSSAGEPGTLGNADKAGLFPLFPAVPGASDQGCNAEPREPERERADGAAPEADDAAPGDPPEALPFRLAAWADPADTPKPGDTCGTCSRRAARGGRWWCESVAPKGWRCARCHRADHLAAGAATEVAT